MKFKNLIVFIASATFIGCTSVDLKKPATRLMSPETSGGFLEGLFAVQLLGTANIKLIKEPTSSTPSSNPNVDEAQDIGVQFHLGLHKRVDTYFDTSMLGPNATGLKIQILGSSVAESKAGDWSLSLFGAPLWGDWKQEDKTNSGQPNEIKSETVVSLNGFEAGASLGYRVFEEFLTYVTVYHSSLNGKATLDQTDSGVFTDNLVQVEGEGTVQSLALGVILGRGAFVQLEGAYTLGEWEKTSPSHAEAESLGNFMAGVNAGLNW